MIDLNIRTISDPLYFGWNEQSIWMWSLSVPICSNQISYRSVIAAAISLIAAVIGGSNNALRYLTGKTM